MTMHHLKTHSEVTDDMLDNSLVFDDERTPINGLSDKDRLLIALAVGCESVVEMNESGNVQIRSKRPFGLYSLDGKVRVVEGYGSKDTIRIPINA